MQIQVLQNDLQAALSTALRFTTNKAQLPILSNVVLKASKNSLNIQATDLEMAASLNIGAKVTKEGDITIPAKTLFDLISNLKDEQVELSAEKEVLSVSSESFESTINGMNSADFPEVPKELDKKQIEVATDKIKKALEKCMFAVSADESRPILTGVLFEFGGKELKVVATDGFRLSVEKLTLSKSMPKMNVVVPKNILSEIIKAASEDNLSFSVNKQTSQISFGFPRAVFSSRILQGEFPNYQKIIPTSHKTKIDVAKGDLEASVKLAAVFARESSNVVRVQVAKGGVEVFAESSKSGKQKNKVAVKVEGDKLEIAFNYRFLLDVLQAIESEDVVVEFSGGDAPAVFRDGEDKDFVHLVMPVKI